MAGCHRNRWPDASEWATYILGSNLGQFLASRIENETTPRGSDLPQQSPRYGKLNDPNYNQGDFVFRIRPLEGAALTPSPPPRPVVAEQGPPTFIDTAVQFVAREAQTVHAIVGTPALVGFGLVLGFFWCWRANARLLLSLRPGTPGMDEEIANAQRAGLRAQTYRQTLQAWLDWLSAKLGGSHPWGSGAYDAMFKLAVAYPIIGVFLVWAITGENTSGVEGLLPKSDTATRWAFIGSLGFMIVATAQITRTISWSFLLRVAGPFAVAFAFTVASAVAFVVVSAVVFAFAVAVADAPAGTGALA